MMIIERVNDIQDNLNQKFTGSGFEFHPFLIGWYHEKVSKSFRVNYPEDTVAFVVVSTPDMFEKSFLPFITRKDCNTDIRDPLDQCIAATFNDIKDDFPDYTIETIHDFERHHSNRPKFLMQTASHISGAAYYYQQKDIGNTDLLTGKKRLCGVCIHPKYGGWFALRGVIIFGNLQCEDLPRREAVDVVVGDELRLELLERFNYRWQDWTFRDIISVKSRYSEAQKLYFATKPKDRKELIATNHLFDSFNDCKEEKEIDG
ncbi:cyanocobalamin reductase / alkylcobalamin dealkylase-like [Tubulanus polymorphus]|uniref:cyanocobalamin reductase / alkylcobalamin dealkylase-like n=1 Tax=Tubulanus polymorphus TaxID=672921 RepID=UPI003DA525DA